MRGNLQESDQVGEEEEESGVGDPLEHSEEDEGPAVNDEARGEDGLDAPDGEVLADQRTCGVSSSGR